MRGLFYLVLFCFSSNVYNQIVNQSEEIYYSPKGDGFLFSVVFQYSSLQDSVLYFDASISELTIRGYRY
jgi:hypothetical protein